MRHVLPVVALGLALGLALLARAQSDQVLYLPLVIRASSADAVPTAAATASPSVTVTSSPTAAYTLTPRPTSSATPSATATATPTAIPTPANLACVMVDQVEICAWVSDPTPHQYTLVTAYGRLRLNGVGVSDLQMSATWHLGSVTVQCFGVTSAAGVASCSRNLGAATAGRSVTVDVSITYQGRAYTATTSFVPVAATPTPAPTAPLVIIGVTPTGPDEVVEVRNTGSLAQSMAGWTLQSWDGTTTPCTPEPEQIFSFPSDFTLAAGAAVRIHSGATGGNRPRTPTDLPWTTRHFWNDDGDRGDLRSPAGQVVSSYRYGRCQ